METLAKLLTGTRTEPEQPTPPAPRSMVVKSVTAHSGGVASFEVYDLQSLKIGYFNNRDARQFGQAVPWQFDTQVLYNEGRGAIIHSLELVRLSGRDASSPGEGTAAAVDATYSHSYTHNGLQWSQPRLISGGKPGDTQKRVGWRTLGRMDHWRGLRFRGLNNPYPESIVRLEAEIELLAQPGKPRLFKGYVAANPHRTGTQPIPVHFSFAEHDHIVPYDAAKHLITKIGSADKEEVMLKGGHVSLVAGANAIKRLWPKLDSWLGKRST